MHISSTCLDSFKYYSAKIGHNRINSVENLNRMDFRLLEKISLGFRQSSSFEDYKNLLKLSSRKMKTIYLSTVLYILDYLRFIQFYDKSLHHKYKELHVVSLNNCQYSNGRKNLWVNFQFFFPTRNTLASKSLLIF